MAHIMLLLCAPALPAFAQGSAPLLSEGPTSTHYQIRFLNNPYMANIAFHTRDKFFLIEGTEFIKVDRQGQDVFRLAATAITFRPRFSSYVVTPKGIYDFSEVQPQQQPFVQIVNDDADRTLTRDSFFQIFGQAYKNADVVIYGEIDSNISRLPAYMRIAGEWILFYISPSNIDIEQDFDLGDQVERFPAKFARMIMLRDPARKQYAHNSRRLRDEIISLPEDGLTYPSNPSLSVLSYSSSYVSDEYVYTPIPALFAGLAGHRLDINGEVLDFMEIAVRPSLSLTVETHLNLFVLPEPYANNIPVSFLEFRPGNNIDTRGGDGVHVVHPKD